MILVDVIVMKILLVWWVKGYTWNPSTCECQCDKLCKPGQYLDHKNCICKNKLIGRVIEKCTSVINETMINNNKDNITTNNTCLILFFGNFNFIFNRIYCVFNRIYLLLLLLLLSS